jgi:hypothetical protein
MYEEKRESGSDPPPPLATAGEEVTIPVALALLAARGVVMQAHSLRSHCRRGTIPARHSNPANPLRGEWLIPAGALATWHPQPPGKTAVRKAACLVCGKPTPRGRARYCSRACYEVGKRSKPVVNP